MAKGLKQYQRTLRKVVALSAVATCAILVGVTIHTKITAIDPVAMVGELPFNEQIRSAIALSIDRSKDFAQLALLVLAALWGLIVAKKDEARIALSDWPELLMLGSASILLIFSLQLRSFYLENIAEFYITGAKTCATPTYSCIPDLFAPTIEYYFDYQVICVVGGIALGILTLFSSHRLKETP
jgi:hypothetical protein